MRAALSLLFLSAVLFLPCVAPAAEPAQASPATTDTVNGVSEPSDGALSRLFGWFKGLGDLKLDGEVADEESRRYQDGQYVYWNGGNRGYHFVADISPDIKPGFYMLVKDDGALTAELSMMDPATVPVIKEGQKPYCPNNFCMFLGPDMDPSFSDGRDKGLGPDMPALNVHEGSSPGTDLGVRCGVTWKFK